MLSALYIENLAVIEKSYIEFGKGFSVFTGETGAGKSIIIDAINACLGQRTSRDIVRSGTEKASIMAVFRDVPEKVRRQLENNGYQMEGNELIMERIIHTDGRSSARMNGRPAPISLLREVGAGLINIHGQHDNQALLSPERHLDILDNFGELQPEIERYQKKFGELREVLRKLHTLTANEAEKEKRAEILRFQIEEIQSARLTPGIEERLTEKSRRYRSVERIAKALASACTALLGDEEEMQGAADLLGVARDEMNGLADFPEFLKVVETLEGLALEASEIAASLHSQLTSLEYDQQEADLVEAKLSQINRLKIKYGGTVAQILDYLEDAKRELASIVNSKEQIHQWNQQAIRLKKEAVQMAQELTKHRKTAAERFVSRVAEEARFLEMPNLRLEAAFSQSKLGMSGDSTMEFQISTNLGEPPKAISKIASGGELSRIMLAMKSALAEKDEIGTLIFDEIDTGVSGRAAQKIGLKLREVARSRQVLCVTHSAQVAALGNAQYLIKKSSEAGKTFTHVMPLDMEGRVDEIARIMATDQVSGLARETARRMLLSVQEDGLNS